MPGAPARGRTMGDRGIPQRSGEEGLNLRRRLSAFSYLLARLHFLRRAVKRLGVSL
jgi:hypothetical protein